MRSQVSARFDDEQQQCRERRAANQLAEQAAPKPPSRPASKRGRSRKKTASVAEASPVAPNNGSLPPTFSGTEAHIALLAENDTPTENGIFVHTVVGPADDTVRKIAGLYARLRTAQEASRPSADTEPTDTSHRLKKDRCAATTALENDILQLNDRFGGLSASAKLLYVCVRALHCIGVNSRRVTGNHARFLSTKIASCRLGVLSLACWNEMCLFLNRCDSNRYGTQLRVPGTRKSAKHVSEFHKHIQAQLQSLGGKPPTCELCWLCESFFVLGPDAGSCDSACSRLLVAPPGTITQRKMKPRRISPGRNSSAHLQSL